MQNHSMELSFSNRNVGLSCSYMYMRDVGTCVRDTKGLYAPRIT